MLDFISNLFDLVLGLAFQLQFIHPSPTNGSEFSCTPGQPCHVMFSTGKHLNQKW